MVFGIFCLFFISFEHTFSLFVFHLNNLFLILDAERLFTSSPNRVATEEKGGVGRRSLFELMTKLVPMSTEEARWNSTCLYAEGQHKPLPVNDNVDCRVNGVGQNIYATKRREQGVIQKSHKTFCVLK